ncbi:hypothetical protein J3R82DRAFT_11196 [Butyriboletus roseoflavus]|nr:hypothetical protein J3R82DRAFT_11196 [Butyriboletus roseoflavus]
MATAVSRYTPQTQADNATFNCLDAKSIACNGNGMIVYTSLNMSFIPEPYDGDKKLHAHVDGQFGPIDCFQLPQVHCKEYEYAICIPQSECHPSPNPLSWAWYHPSLEDFETLHHTAFLVGRLNQDKAVGVASLHQITIIQYNDWKKTRGDKKDIISQLFTAFNHDLMLLFNHCLTSMISSYSWLKFNIVFWTSWHLSITSTTSFLSPTLLPPLPRLL